MTIDGAIKVLNSLERTLAPTMAASGTDAIKLGIEALERERNYRKGYMLKWHPLLPSETKD